MRPRVFFREAVALMLCFRVPEFGLLSVFGYGFGAGAADRMEDAILVYRVDESATDAGGCFSGGDEHVIVIVRGWHAGL